MEESDESSLALLDNWRSSPPSSTRSSEVHPRQGSNSNSGKRPQQTIPVSKIVAGRLPNEEELPLAVAMTTNSKAATNTQNTKNQSGKSTAALLEGGVNKAGKNNSGTHVESSTTTSSSLPDMNCTNNRHMRKKEEFVDSSMELSMPLLKDSSTAVTTNNEVEGQQSSNSFTKHVGGRRREKKRNPGSSGRYKMSGSRVLFLEEAEEDDDEDDDDGGGEFSNSFKRGVHETAAESLPPSRSSPSCAQRINWGLLSCTWSFFFCVIGTLVVLLTDQHDIGRFFLAAGIYGLAGGISNFVAVKFLLQNMFLSRHEDTFQASIRSIVMTIFFSRESIEWVLIDQIKREVATISWQKNFKQFFESPKLEEWIDRKLYEFSSGPEGMMLSMFNMPPERLKPFVQPLVLSLATELTPIFEEQFSIHSIVTPERISTILENVVSARLQALSIADVKSIVSEVLSPHLAVIVLWGTLFGNILGIVSEIFQISKFLSTKR